MNASCDFIVEQTPIQLGNRSIETRIYYPEEGKPSLGTLIAPPHAYLGGNFDNNVVAHLASELASRGWLAVTYNLPGVGSSSSRNGALTRESFWEDPSIGEEGILDALDYGLIADVVRNGFGITPDKFLAFGYSYGGAVALLSNIDPPPFARILISPPIPQLNPDLMKWGGVPSLAVFGEDDLAADADSVEALGRAEIPELTIFEIPGADHFYRDHLNVLSGLCVSFIGDVLDSSMPFKG